MSSITTNFSGHIRPFDSDLDSPPLKRTASDLLNRLNTLFGTTCTQHLLNLRIATPIIADIDIITDLPALLDNIIILVDHSSVIQDLISGIIDCKYYEINRLNLLWRNLLRLTDIYINQPQTPVLQAIYQDRETFASAVRGEHLIDLDAVNLDIGMTLDNVHKMNDVIGLLENIFGSECTLRLLRLRIATPITPEIHLSTDIHTLLEKVKVLAKSSAVIQDLITTITYCEPSAINRLHLLWKNLLLLTDVYIQRPKNTVLRIVFLDRERFGKTIKGEHLIDVDIAHKCIDVMTKAIFGGINILEKTPPLSVAENFYKWDKLAAYFDKPGDYLNLFEKKLAESPVKPLKRQEIEFKEKAEKRWAGPLKKHHLIAQQLLFANTMQREHGSLRTQVPLSSHTWFMRNSGEKKPVCIRHRWNETRAYNFSLFFGVEDYVCPARFGRNEAYKDPYYSSFQSLQIGTLLTSFKRSKSALISQKTFWEAGLTAILIGVSNFQKTKIMITPEYKIIFFNFDTSFISTNGGLIENKDGNECHTPFRYPLLEWKHAGIVLEEGLKEDLKLTAQTWKESSFSTYVEYLNKFSKSITLGWPSLNETQLAALKERIDKICEFLSGDQPLIFANLIKHIFPTHALITKIIYEKSNLQSHIACDYSYHKFSFLGNDESSFEETYKKFIKKILHILKKSDDSKWLTGLTEIHRTMIKLDLYNTAEITEWINTIIKNFRKPPKNSINLFKAIPSL